MFIPEKKYRYFITPQINQLKEGRQDDIASSLVCYVSEVKEEKKNFYRFSNNNYRMNEEKKLRDETKSKKRKRNEKEKLK